MRQRTLAIRRAVVASALAVALEAVAAASAPPQKQVLVVYSTRRDAQIVAIGERELPRILEQGLGSSTTTRSTSTRRGFRTAIPGGLPRVPPPEVQERALRRGHRRAGRRARSRQRRPTRVVSRHADRLLCDGPASGHVENATGLVTALNFSDTLALIDDLQPEVRQIFVVSGAAPTDQRVRAIATAPVPAVRVPIHHHLSHRPAHCRARVPPLDASRPTPPSTTCSSIATATARTFIHSTTWSGWRRSPTRRSIAGSTRRSDAASSAAASRINRTARSRRPACPPRAVRRAGRQHPGLLAKSERQAGRLAPAAALGHQRVPRAPRHASALQGTLRLGSLQDLHPRRSGGAARADAPHRRAARSATRRRLAEDRLRGSEEALRRSYDRIRDSRLPAAARPGHRTLSHRPRAARRHQPAGRPPLDRSRAAERRGSARQQVARGRGTAPGADIARSVHDLSHRLHPAKLRLIGLVAALHALQRELSRSDPTITFTHEHVPANLPPDLTLSLFRIVQEALQNAMKYSRARQDRRPARRIGRPRAHGVGRWRRFRRRGGVGQGSWPHQHRRTDRGDRRHTRHSIDAGGGTSSRSPFRSRLGRATGSTAAARSDRSAPLALPILHSGRRRPPVPVGIVWTPAAVATPTHSRQTG